MEIEYMFAICLVALFISGCVWARASEHKTWNDGICSECTKRWVCFDMASDGSRGYRCVGCQRTKRIWISWAVDTNPRLIDD